MNKQILGKTSLYKIDLKKNKIIAHNVYFKLQWLLSSYQSHYIGPKLIIVHGLSVSLHGIVEISLYLEKQNRSPKKE